MLKRIFFLTSFSNEWCIENRDTWITYLKSGTISLSLTSTLSYLGRNTLIWNYHIFTHSHLWKLNTNKLVRIERARDREKERVRNSERGKESKNDYENEIKWFLISLEAQKLNLERFISWYKRKVKRLIKINNIKTHTQKNHNNNN